METTGHNTPLSPDECRQLLRSQAVGRVGWVSRSGLVILPVSYALDGDDLIIRTAAGSLLSELAEHHAVGFEIDDLDGETLTGWSVVVQGVSEPTADPGLSKGSEPWAPGERHVFIRIVPASYSGRAIAASEESPRDASSL